MKIAIIGGGIVGSTCAYYLSKENIDISLFDYGVGQASKASAGIISPWFSKRRNKSWYKMASLGAEFYQKLIYDLKQDNINTDFYKQVGVYILKKDDTKLEELLEIAKKRREQSSLIGDLKILSKKETQEKISSIDNINRVLFASGGARIEGECFVKTLLKASKINVINKKVSVKKENEKYIIDNKQYDKIILATGAWLKEILTPLDYNVDVRPQKGQLRDYKIKNKKTGDYPVIMPEGELDIIPFENGVISIGATHEDNKQYDLTIDKNQLDIFEKEATKILTELETADIINERVGTRAYTSDYSPFYGELKDDKNILVASGLGSSGLTTGPIIGYDLAMLLLNKQTILNSEDYSTSKYIKKKL